MMESYTGGSGGFVASTAAPIATGWSDPVPGRAFLPAVVQRLSQRTEIAWLQLCLVIIPSAFEINEI